MELTDEAKAEIAAAIKILRDDGIHIHKTYAGFLKSQNDKPGDDKEPESVEGGPPPVKETKNEPPKPEKMGLWWRDRTSD
jgi:hypothetical protein